MAKKIETGRLSLQKCFIKISVFITVYCSDTVGWVTGRASGLH